MRVTLSLVTLRPLGFLVLCLPGCGSDAPPYIEGATGTGTSTVGAGGSAVASTNGGDAGAAGAAGAGGAAGAAGGAGAPGSGGFPGMLYLTGTAEADVNVVGPGEGGAAGAPALPTIDRVECHFYAEVFDWVEESPGAWSALAAGEVFRAVYSGERKFEFAAIFGGPTTFSVGSDGSVELRAVGDQTGAKPFWRELEVLEGETTAEHTYAGAWTCASLELDDPGFPDHGGVATGSWELEPVEQ